MADLELFNAPQSTCSQRARFVLNAKHLGYRDTRLDLFSGDQLKPAYLQSIRTGSCRRWSMTARS
jgi:hypothetical protein